MEHQTHTDLALLTAVEHHALHGYAIFKTLNQREQTRFVRPSPLYPALHRLEQSGFIASEQQPHKEKTRTAYRITPAGQRHLSTLRSQLDTYLSSVAWLKGSGHTGSAVSGDLT